MSTKKIITVLGATGAQGGGLVRAILADPHSMFSVRAVTRDAKSQRAQALARLGAEVVEADIDDEASLVNALEGSFGAFFVTFFWAHFSPAKEQAQARAMANAAKATGVQHAIWSTLEDTRQWLAPTDTRMPMLMDKYRVPHFDAKGESNRFFVDAGVPTTFLYTSFYWDNLVEFDMGPKRGADGGLAFGLPMADKRLPGIVAEDIGRCAYGIFKAGPEYLGKKVGIAGEHLTVQQMARSLSVALQEPVRVNDITPQEYRALGFPGADDLGNMFQFKRDFEQEFCAARSVDLSRRLNPSLQTFHGWLAQNKARLKLE